MADAAKVLVGVTGEVKGAPLGTALPVTAIATENIAFVAYGYVSEEGVTESINLETTDIKAWQNGDIVRKIQTSHDVTYAMSFMETSPEVLEMFYGNYTAGVVQVTGEQGIRQSWILEVEDGDNKLRIVIPDGQITDRGDISYVNGDAVLYPVTITAYPDVSGVKAYKYLDEDLQSA